MIKYSNYQYCKCFILLTVFIDFSTPYKMLSVDNDKLCSPITKRKIKLGTDSTSGLIVTLGRLSDHILEWEKNFPCKFQVDAIQSKNGIFAVIQSMVFRKNESTDQCIDYVQYKRQNGSTSRKYCGRLHSALGMDSIFAPDNFATNLAPTITSFDDPMGQLDVYIYISREPLHTYEEMELELVFTSYRNCFHPSITDRQCSETYNLKCIYNEFFYDGFVNCPYPDCVDEDGCSGKVSEHKKSVGNKVIIGSVTLLLVLFVLFICFIWLCRKYKKLCWAEGFANPTTSSTNNRTIELREPSSGNNPLQSTPRSNVTETFPAGPSEEDKDLPPSYESLFPDR